MNNERISLAEQEALSRIREDFERVVSENSRLRAGHQRGKRGLRLGLAAAAVSLLCVFASFTVTSNILDSRSPEPFALHSKQFKPVKTVKFVSTGNANRAPAKK
jgi:hypothetical protein